MVKIRIVTKSFDRWKDGSIYSNKATLLSRFYFHDEQIIVVNISIKI